MRKGSVHRVLRTVLYLLNHTGESNFCTQQEIKKALNAEEIPCADDTMTKIMAEMLDFFNPKIYDHNADEFVIKFNNWEEYYLAETENIPKITKIYLDRKALEKWIDKNLQTESPDIAVFQIGDKALIESNANKIAEAIKKSRMITFSFASGKQHKVSPYFVVNYLGRTYLLCNKPPYEDVGIYRVDLMRDIEITEEKAKSIYQQKEWSGSKSPIAFMQSHIGATYGDLYPCTLKVKTKYRALIDDNFGSSIESEKELDNDYTEFHVKATEKGILDLAFSASDRVEIIRPEKFRNNLKEKLQTVLKQYQD